MYIDKEGGGLKGGEGVNLCINLHLNIHIQHGNKRTLNQESKADPGLGRGVGGLHIPPPYSNPVKLYNNYHIIENNLNVIQFNSIQFSLLTN